MWFSSAAGKNWASVPSVRFGPRSVRFVLYRKSIYRSRTLAVRCSSAKFGLRPAT
jgi:hypothetical protein